MSKSRDAEQRQTSSHVAASANQLKRHNTASTQSRPSSSTMVRVLGGTPSAPPDVRPSGSLRHLPAPPGAAKHTKVGLTADRLELFYSDDIDQLRRLSQSLYASIDYARVERDASDSRGNAQRAAAWKVKHDADFATKEGIKQMMWGMLPEHAERYAEEKFAKLQATVMPNEPSSSACGNALNAPRPAPRLPMRTWKDWHNSPRAKPKDLEDLNSDNPTRKALARNRIGARERRAWRKGARPKQQTQVAPSLPLPFHLPTLSPSQVSAEARLAGPGSVSPVVNHRPNFLAPQPAPRSVVSSSGSRQPGALNDPSHNALTPVSNLPLLAHPLPASSNDSEARFAKFLEELEHQASTASSSRVRSPSSR